MQEAQKLYREGNLSEAIGSLQAYLRDRPTERAARSFLFELLCFAGEFDRARKQLSVLADGSNENRLGTAFYLAALNAETQRQAWYEGIPAPDAASAGLTDNDSVGGLWNGKRFHGIRDLDSRLGASLEFLAAGNYHRIAFRNLRRITLDRPTRLRDLYWRTASAETSAEMGASELTSILIPVLYPQTWLFDDDRTRLGRTTDFALSESGVEHPFGQRILQIGDEQVPLIEVDAIEFHAGEFDPLDTAEGENG